MFTGMASKRQIFVGGVPIGGGAGSVNVQTTAGCGWTATSGAPWITITSGGSGAGNGAVQFTAAANTGSSSLEACVGP